MATITPDSYSDSDSDNYSDSDYGFNLTAEEEEAITTLVTRASSKTAGPVLIASASSRNTAVNSSLEVDINAAFSTCAGVKSLAHQDIDLDAAGHDGGFTDGGRSGVLPALAKGDERPLPTIASHDASLVAPVDTTKPRSIPTLAAVDDISYPDCEFRELASRGRSGMALTDLEALSEQCIGKCARCTCHRHKSPIRRSTAS